MFKGYMWHMSKALQPHIRKSRMHISLEVDEVWGQWNSFALHICLTDCFGCFILRISHIITLHFHCIYSSSLASLASFSQIHVLYFNNVYVCSTKSNQCCIYRYTHVYICVCLCVYVCVNIQLITIGMCTPPRACPWRQLTLLPCPTISLLLST